MKIATVLPGYPLSGECWVLDELTVESIAERLGVMPAKILIVGDTVHVAGRPYAEITDSADVPDNLVGAWTPQDRLRCKAEASAMLTRKAAREALAEPVDPNPNKT